MRQSTEARLRKIEAALVPQGGRVHVVYVYDHADDGQAQVDAMITAGAAITADLFVVIRKPSRSGTLQ